MLGKGWCGYKKCLVMKCLNFLIFNVGHLGYIELNSVIKFVKMVEDEMNFFPHDRIQMTRYKVVRIYSM